MYNIFLFNLLLSVILSVITMYINLCWMSNLARVLATCIRHPDVHNFTTIAYLYDYCIYLCI